MRHLVTGGSGFLGNLVARRLLEQGEAVRVLDVWEDASRPDGIEFVRCDVRDRQGLARALRGVDVVHDTVAVNPISKSRRDFREVNVEAVRNVAEEAAAAGVEALIHISSSAVFGRPRECPIRPETPPAPIEIYGRTKLAGELAVREVCQRHRLPLITIRPRTILGGGRLGLFHILFDWIREGRNVYVIGSGENAFQFIHADDLIDFYMLALSAGKPGVYNVGTDQFGTLRHDLEELISYAGSRSKVKGLPALPAINALRVLDWIGASPLAPWHYLTYHVPYYFDVAPLLAMGWKPNYSNGRMFREGYDWFLANAERLEAEKEGSPHRRPVKEGILWLVRKLS